MGDIACGMKEAGLAEFAVAVNASYMSQWLELGLYDEGLEGWGEAFVQAVTRPLAVSGRIHFNLTGLDVAEALKGDPDTWAGRYTAWELQQIVRRDLWYASTTFYLDGDAMSESQLNAMGIEAPVGSEST